MDIHNANLPNCYVVIDRLRIDYREIDVDAVSGRYSDSPHAVLEMGILGWVSGRINCTVHRRDVATTESCDEGKKFNETG